MTIFTKKFPIGLYQMNTIPIDENYKLIDVFIDEDYLPIALFHNISGGESGVNTTYKIYVNTIGNSIEERHDYVQDATIFYKILSLLHKEYYDFRESSTSCTIRVLRDIQPTNYIVYVNKLM